jgi:hypothetical protein
MIQELFGRYYSMSLICLNHLSPELKMLIAFMFLIWLLSLEDDDD